MTEKKANLRTLSVWAGEEKKDGWQRATQVPVVHSVSYGYDDINIFVIIPILSTWLNPPHFK